MSHSASNAKERCAELNGIQSGGRVRSVRRTNILSGQSLNRMVINVLPKMLFLASTLQLGLECLKR
jgi:hypothetical protein